MVGFFSHDFQRHKNDACIIKNDATSVRLTPSSLRVPGLGLLQGGMGPSRAVAPSDT